MNGAFKDEDFPVEIKDCKYGKCAVASRELPENTAVGFFKGPVVKEKDVPEEEIRNVLIIDKGLFCIPKTNARYFNHSCNPNCVLDYDCVIRTLRSVKSGEELTYSYNMVFYEELEDGGPEDVEFEEWDPRWNFKCMCGSPNCQGMVDKWIMEDGKPYKRNQYKK
ncbi:MAG: SET domain-containing protein [Candidatus Nanoarchaeia archaeon]|nr:SET domain-containing protein [Candidatus Nanoarchaeia archaeon]